MTRVKTDLEACQGYANCVVAADDAFDLDDDGKVVIVIEDVPESERGRIEAAARTCPASALWLED
jgi:ferredoxin